MTRRGRPSPGQALAALGGLGLIVSLWLDWYEITGPELPDDFSLGRALDTTFTAWQVFDVTDVILFAVGALAIALPVVALTQRTPAVPIALDSTAALIGIAALVLVVFRFFEFPGSDPPDPFDIEREIGLWLALASVLALVAGTLLSMRDEGLGPKRGRWQPGEESPVPARPVPEPQAGSTEPPA